MSDVRCSLSVFITKPQVVHWLGGNAEVHAVASQCCLFVYGEWP